MKRLNIYLTLLIASLLVMTMASCRTNNGDIGHLYGQWRMTALILADGTERQVYDNYLRFQNDIVQFTVTADHHDALSAFGRWRREGDIVTLDFTGNMDAEGNLAPNTALGWFELTGQLLMRCEILTETRRGLVLRTASPDGPITYLFDKVQ